jgi:hypothetical protein
MNFLSILLAIVIGCAKSPVPEVVEPVNVEEESETSAPDETEESNEAQAPSEVEIQAGNQPPQEGGGKYLISCTPWANVTILATDKTPEITGKSPLSGMLPAGDYKGALKTADGKETSFSITIKRDGTSKYCWDFDTESECEK